MQQRLAEPVTGPGATVPELEARLATRARLCVSPFVAPPFVQSLNADAPTPQLADDYTTVHLQLAKDIVHRTWCSRPCTTGSTNALQLAILR